MNHHYVAIMAGGIGSRFWPISRERYPKQFLDILGTGETLLQATFRRFAAFIPIENILVVTAELYKDLVSVQLPQIPSANILCEPMRKNTAPCVAYVSFRLSERDNAAKVIFAPSDHYIKDEETFKNTCLTALEFIEKSPKNFMVLGVQPTHPHTGYGYIQYCEEEKSDCAIYKVKTFTEKPTLKLAETFLAHGDFLWNAGIFIMENQFLQDMFSLHSKEIYDLFNAHRTLFNTQMEARALERIYPQCPSNSFDYEIMEKVKEVYVMPAHFDWNDIGSWNSLYDLTPPSERVPKNIMTYDSKNNLTHIQNSDKLVVLQGLEDYIIVDTNDVLLICKKEKEQEIKKYVEAIKVNKGDKYL